MGMDAEITSDVNQSQWKRWFNLLKAGRLIDIYFFKEVVYLSTARYGRDSRQSNVSL